MAVRCLTCPLLFKSYGFKKDRGFLGIFLNVFLPNLFTAASGLPLSDFALLYFSREPEELSISLPEATSDLFSHGTFVASVGKGILTSAWLCAV